MNTEEKDRRMHEIRKRARQIMDRCNNDARGPFIALAGSGEGEALQKELDQLRVEYAELSVGMPRKVGIL